MKKLYIGSTYKHYKGNKYVVVGVAKHSETLEELVVYRACHDDDDLWVRPKEMFLEDVEVDGKKMPRFELVIESRRLILQPISLDYSEDIFREFIDKVTKWLVRGPNESFEKTKEFIVGAIQSTKEGTQLKLIATSKENEFLGLCELKNPDTKTPEFGLWLKESVQGKGYGTELILALFEWASKNLDIDYFIYRADKENVGSWKIAEKLVEEFGGEFIGEEPAVIRGKDTITREYKVLPKV
jgi:RimJ/RimL family protein N-acetyltransferase